MRTQPLVLATEYNVSTTSGTDVEGVLLDVYKIDHTRPYPEQVVYAVREMQFTHHDEADAYCLKHGWLKVYESKTK